MLPNYNSKYVCKQCKNELPACDKEYIKIVRSPRLCVKCGSEMEPVPLVHKGPEPDHPFKKD